MPKQQRSIETQARILEAAQLAFANNGYDATGVAEICRAAGVSKGAFYHHFATKQAVFLLLLGMWLAELDEHLWTARQGASSVAEALARMVERAPEVFNAADGRLQLLLEFWSRAIHDPAVWRETILPYQRFQAFFTDMVREGMASGELRQGDPELVSRTILSLALGLLLQNLMDPAGADWEAAAIKTLPLLMSGLSA